MQNECMQCISCADFEGAGQLAPSNRSWCSISESNLTLIDVATPTDQHAQKSKPRDFVSQSIEHDRENCAGGECQWQVGGLETVVGLRKRAEHFQVTL
jgi:hypothetical protein